MIIDIDMICIVRNGLSLINNVSAFVTNTAARIEIR